LYGGIDGKENGFESWRNLYWAVERFEIAAKIENKLEIEQF
jgi:hypothetical protein